MPPAAVMMSLKAFCPSFKFSTDILLVCIICGAQRSNYNMRIGFFQSLDLIGAPVDNVTWSGLGIP
jgi:hypothetical protein